MRALPRNWRVISLMEVASESVSTTWPVSKAGSTSTTVPLSTMTSESRTMSMRDLS